MKIGAQLFTVRKFCSNTAEFAETLKKVADMGYTAVQVSGTCPYQGEWLADQLKSTGLSCIITHCSADRILNETELLAAEHKLFNCKYIGLSGVPIEFEEISDFALAAKSAAEQLHRLGCRFMYHNHSWEYEIKLPDGRNIMEYLSDTFTPEEMGFTLDTYWVKFGGYEPLDEIRRLKGRLPVVHYKDMHLDSEGKRTMQWIGGGNVMDFEKLTAAFIDAGTEYAMVEQDDCNGEDPFLCLKKSYDYLRSIGLN